MSPPTPLVFLRTKGQVNHTPQFMVHYHHSSVKTPPLTDFFPSILLILKPILNKLFL